MCNHKHRITAIIYDKHNRVISIGHNSYIKTHTLQARYAKQVGLDNKIFLHAEMDAIIRAGIKIKNAYKICVFRFNLQGEPRCAKPCPICSEAIRHTPIKIIEHT